MNDKKNGDPIGFAIQEYSKKRKPEDIIVSSDICEDDIIPVEVLFRNFEEMPDIEKEALALCKGKVLDVGAGAGVHALHLQDLGMDVTCIDVSPGAVDFMKANGLKAEQATDLLSYLIDNGKKKCCVEMVEINPTLDTHNLMAEKAFQILLNITSAL